MTKREKLCDMLQRLKKLNDSMTVATVEVSEGPDNFRQNSSNYRL